MTIEAACCALAGMGYQRCEGLVAGGAALRSLFPHFPTKDTDLFVMRAQPSPAAKRWLKKFGARWLPNDAAAPYEMELGSPGHYLVGELDIIFSPRDSYDEILHEFDLGVSQVGLNLTDNLLLLTEKAVQDITQHTVTVLRDHPTGNNMARARKYADRLGWRIVTSTPTIEEGLLF
jgi:hypothetical protein